MNNEKYGVMYGFSPEHDLNPDDSAAIRILEPDFFGIVFRFNTVTVKEENDHAVLKFDYSIIEGSVPDSELVEFELRLGNLLHDILVDDGTE